MAIDGILERIGGISDEAIGFRVALRRDMLGLSMEEAAKRFGVQDITWRRWENGERRFTAETLARLAEILDCSIHYLLDLPGEFGLRAEDHYLVMLWRELPTPQENPWIKPSLLETLRRTVKGYVEERAQSAPSSLDAEASAAGET